jgi:hypothetical protein
MRSVRLYNFVILILPVILFVYTLFEFLFSFLFIDSILSVASSVKIGVRNWTGLDRREYSEVLRLTQFLSIFSFFNRRKTKNIAAVREAVMLETAETSIRKQPFGVLLSGEAGSGKTGVAIRLANYYLRKTYGDSTTDDIVVINETDEFQSEFRTCHKVVIFDDLAQAKEGVSTMDPFRKLIDFINNIRKTSLNPNLEMKGKVFIEPDLVIVTTNRTLMDMQCNYSLEAELGLVHTIQSAAAWVICPAAIARRFGVQAVIKRVKQDQRITVYPTEHGLCRSEFHGFEPFAAHCMRNIKDHMIEQEEYVTIINKTFPPPKKILWKDSWRLFYITFMNMIDYYNPFQTAPVLVAQSGDSTVNESEPTAFDYLKEPTAYEFLSFLNRCPEYSGRKLNHLLRLYATFINDRMVLAKSVIRSRKNKEIPEGKLVAHGNKQSIRDLDSYEFHYLEMQAGVLDVDPEEFRRAREEAVLNEKIQKLRESRFDPKLPMGKAKYLCKALAKEGQTGFNWDTYDLIPWEEFNHFSKIVMWRGGYMVDCAVVSYFGTIPNNIRDDTAFHVALQPFEWHEVALYWAGHRINQKGRLVAHGKSFQPLPYSVYPADLDSPLRIIKEECRDDTSKPVIPKEFSLEERDQDLDGSQCSDLSPIDLSSVDSVSETAKILNNLKASLPSYDSLSYSSSDECEYDKLEPAKTQKNEFPVLYDRKGIAQQYKHLSNSEVYNFVTDFPEVYADFPPAKVGEWYGKFKTFECPSIREASSQVLAHYFIKRRFPHFECVAREVFINRVAIDLIYYDKKTGNYVFAEAKVTGKGLDKQMNQRMALLKKFKDPYFQGGIAFNSSCMQLVTVSY